METCSRYSCNERGSGGGGGGGTEDKLCVAETNGGGDGDGGDCGGDCEDTRFDSPRLCIVASNSIS